MNARSLLLALLLAAAPLPTHADPRPPILAVTGSQTWEGSGPLKIEREVNASRELSLEVGQNKLMSTSVPLGRVSVANPEVADLKVVTNSQLLITAKAAGDTHLTLWDKQDNPVVLSLHVTRNLDGLRTQLKELFPEEKLNVSSAGELVVLSGEVSDIRLPERILNVARLYAPKIANLLHVSGEQQVQLEVKFAEVSRSGMRELGFNWFANDGLRAGGFVAPGTSVGNFALSPAGAMQPVYAAPFGNAFNVFFSNSGRFPFSVVVSMLEQSSLAKTLAEPTLVAMNGQEARFLAGGEVPIPLSTSLGQVNVEYKKFGVQLKFVPTVLADGLLSLKLATEVSELDASNGVQLNGLQIPGLTTRQSDTTVRLRDGQSFAIAGLLSDKTRSNVSKLPGLGDLPVLGALFRSTQYRRDETELLVVVTAHLVKPVGPRDAPMMPGSDSLSDPNDFQLFLMGKQEVAPDLPAKRGEAIRVEQGGGSAGAVGFMR